MRPSPRRALRAAVEVEPAASCARGRDKAPEYETKSTTRTGYPTIWATNRWLAQIVGYEYVQALIGILGQNNVWLYAARTVREVDAALGAVVEHGLRRVAEADPWLDLA